MIVEDLRLHSSETKYDHTWQFGTTRSQQLAKVEVMSKEYTAFTESLVQYVRVPHPVEALLIEMKGIVAETI